MSDETSEIILKELVREYIKNNLKIGVDITGYYDHMIEVYLLLDGDVIDSDTVVVNKWTAGY